MSREYKMAVGVWPQVTPKRKEVPLKLGEGDLTLLGSDAHGAFHDPALGAPQYLAQGRRLHPDDAAQLRQADFPRELEVAPGDRSGHDLPLPPRQLCLPLKR